jgi:hypothetical protein
MRLNRVKQTGKRKCFFEKKNEKTFFVRLAFGPPVEPDARRNRQRSFGSFFQKITLPSLPPRRTRLDTRRRTTALGAHADVTRAN